VIDKRNYWKSPAGIMRILKPLKEKGDGQKLNTALFASNS
jgi:hypothetical protein